jgi:hypothetical protein
MDMCRIDNKYKCGERTGSNGHVSNMDKREIGCYNMTQMVPRYWGSSSSAREELGDGGLGATSICCSSVCKLLF